MAKMYQANGQTYDIHPMQGKRFEPKELERILRGVEKYQRLNEGGKTLVALLSPSKYEPINYIILRKYGISLYGDVIEITDEEF